MTTEVKVIVSVLFFGQIREMIGASTIELELDSPATVEAAFSLLSMRYSRLADLQRSLLFAVNEEYADQGRRLENGDRLAILPPVSGGSVDSKDIIEVTRETIDVMGLRNRLLTGEAGAVVIFEGVARNNTGGRRTIVLEYEGYTEMALKTMTGITLEVRERWPINSIGIVHRLGRVEITESSVVIVVTSAHRKTAFEAGRYAIDRLKKVVPIWKKEYFEDGAVWVEGETASEDSVASQP